jgi:hypothetical protein
MKSRNRHSAQRKSSAWARLRRRPRWDNQTGLDHARKRPRWQQPEIQANLGLRPNQRGRADGRAALHQSPTMARRHDNGQKGRRIDGYESRVTGITPRVSASC